MTVKIPVFGSTWHLHGPCRSSPVRSFTPGDLSQADTRDQLTLKTESGLGLDSISTTWTGSVRSTLPNGEKLIPCNREPFATRHLSSNWPITNGQKGTQRRSLAEKNGQGFEGKKEMGWGRKINHRNGRENVCRFFWTGLLNNELCSMHTNSVQAGKVRMAPVRVDPHHHSGRWSILLRQRDRECLHQFGLHTLEPIMLVFDRR